MVTRVPIYLGGTGESTQASAQAALGLHTSNSVAFTAVTIGAVNVLANDGATLLTARSNDYNTYLAALSNDYATYLNAQSNDGATLLTARGNDYTTYLAALSNDYATYLNAQSNDGATLLTARSNDWNTYSTLAANDGATLLTARANDHATYYAVLTNPLLYRIDTSAEGGEIAFARAVDNTSAWSIDVFGTLANTSLRFLDTAKAAERMRIDTSGNVGIGTGTPTATLDVVGTFSDAKANTVQQTLTDAATIAWDTSLGRVATVTLGASRTFGAPTNLKVGTYILHVIQGGVGSYTITWNGVFKWTAATAPTLSTAVGRRDIFSFISDGTNLYGAMIPDVR